MNDNRIVIGGSSPDSPVRLNPSMANRHGIIAGATGTGKTVTLQVLAESFAALGVPVVAADIKGDLSGLATPGKENEKIRSRLEKIGTTDFHPRGVPVLFWDVFAERGHPLRTSISEIGPLLLANMLELNETQEAVLQVAFKVADDQGLLILDLKDLRALITWLSENRTEVNSRYGSVHTSSIAAIQRALLVLEESGGELFLGEPALKLEHLMQRDFSGNGVVSILDATKLINSPRLYSTFLLWLLSELFEELPEVGDLALPKLVFFFDEAHLLFKEAPKPLLRKIELLVRLIRSKGVGVFFVTQHPLDIPDTVAGQLGNRIQHALRCFTPRDQAAVKSAAETFRENPKLDVRSAITELAVGEALVSLLDEKGQPAPVERVLISPPKSQIGPLEGSLREEIFRRSPLSGTYENTLDRESAFEILAKRKKEELAKAEEEKEKAAKKKEEIKARSNRQSHTEAFVKSLLRSVGSQVGRHLARGLLGSLKR